MNPKTTKRPKCASCGAADPHVVNRPNGAHSWLCGACELRELNPALQVAANGRKATPLQDETLFPLADYLVDRRGPSK